MVMFLTASFGLQAADTRATTDGLPAALRALQPKSTQILTTKQAQRIRGQGRPKFGPHDSPIKFPANHYTGNRSGQDLKRGAL
jgi:hypothetical protein